MSLTDEGLQVLRRAQDTHPPGLEQRLLSRLTHNEPIQLGDLTSRVLAAGPAVD